MVALSGIHSLSVIYTSTPISKRTPYYFQYRVPFYYFDLTLPTAKAGGFLFQPLLHWLIPYGIATSYTVSTSQIILFPYALRCSLIYIYADCICSPLVKIFILALVSLLCMVWHSGHSHTRTARFFTSGFLYPQQEQV